MSHIRKTLIAIAIIGLMLPAVPALEAAPTGPRFTVCIDPGHGGVDSGAAANGVQEKTVNLDIALRAKEIVQAMGYGVIMTRESDVYVSLQDRCVIANRAGATIFVSIHNNAYTSTSKGTETYCYYSSKEGRRLATFIHQEVVSRIKRTDRGVKEAGFYVLNNTDMTAALVEGAFLTNAEEAKLLLKSSFRQKIAEGVAAGINDYLVDPGKFEEYILMMNPDPEKSASLELTFMRGDGVNQKLRRELPPRSRMTVRVDDYVFNADVSTRVVSKNEVPVIAERAMYFDFEKGRGGHAAAGVPAPSKRWYFAEGSTDWGFSTFILVQNPSSRENRVLMDFMLSSGRTCRYEYTVPAHSRYTLDVSSIRGMEKADFSVNVFSTYPAVAERAMYFNHWGKPGGHDSPGITEPRSRWFLAEGHTGNGFDTYILMGNPGGETAKVSVSYMVPSGPNVVQEYSLPPHSRKTVHVNEVPGLDLTDVSAKVDSSQPILVERSIYFDYRGIREGSNTAAAPATATRWYLAEGYTGGGFDTYILLMNPWANETDVRLEYMMLDGTRHKQGLVLPAHSRRTVRVVDEPGMKDVEFSTRVTSEKPIVVERSMYFHTGWIDGGHCAMGTTEPSLEWYFGEGCTR